MSSEPLLRISNLKVAYGRGEVLLPGVGPIDLDIYPSEAFGVVGESGGGKSTLSLAVMGNLPQAAIIESGKMEFEGRDLLSMGDSARRSVRWKRLAYVPQGAMNALNPVRRIGAQFGDIMRDHIGERRLKQQWWVKVEGLLSKVRLSADVLNKFPHELSGGMRQRVCIAMALVFEPSLIIADEPTSALDVISQREVLTTLAQVRSDYGTAIVLIGHDLAVQAQFADRIGILRKGQLVEVGCLSDVFKYPIHSYTKSLLGSALSIHHRIDLRTIESRSLTPDENTGPLREVRPGHFARIAA
jgi:ABC-type glutathione transport system ATPase component